MQSTKKAKTDSAYGDIDSAYMPAPAQTATSINMRKLPFPGPSPKLKSASVSTAQNNISNSTVTPARRDLSLIAFRKSYTRLSVTPSKTASAACAACSVIGLFIA